MLFIHNDVQKQNLTMAECIAVQDDAFTKIPAGGAVHRPKTDLCYPCDRDDGYFRFSSMEGAYDGIYAMRVYLFSTQNAEPLAILNDGWMQHMRVAGGAGLGVKYLAREDAHVVGMLGSGEMARTHLEAYLEVRDIQQVKVFSPTPANRESYAADMAERFGIEMVLVGSAREAIRGVDILSPCTDSMQPVYDADWLEPGMHVVALQTQETSHEAAARFDVKIRQGIDCMHLSAEQESLRVRRTSGLSWTAFVGGSEEEMTRIPKTVRTGCRSRTTPIFPISPTARYPGAWIVTRSPFITTTAIKASSSPRSAGASIAMSCATAARGKCRLNGSSRICALRRAISWERLKGAMR